MKNNLLSAMTLISAVSLTPYVSASWAKASSYAIGTLKYAASVRGVKDIGAGYLLSMGLSVIHELGHAIAAKLLYGAPFDIILGGGPDDDDGCPFNDGRDPCPCGTECEKYDSHPYLRIGWFKLRSLWLFAHGHSIIGDESTKITPGKNILVTLAGPMSQIVSSIATYTLLGIYAPHYYFTSNVAMAHLFLVIGNCVLPGSDGHKIWKEIKRWCLAPQDQF